MTEILRPRVSVTKLDTVADADYIMDNADTTTEGFVSEASADDSAEVQLFDFEIGRIDSGMRTSATLDISGWSTTAAGDDYHLMYISSDGGTTWTQVDSSTGTTDWGAGPGGTARSFDVATEVGTNGPSLFRLAIVFANSPSGDIPTPSDP